MKIYDTYRLLFESDEELLDEVAWTRDKARMFTRGEIPLTPTVVRKLLGEPERIEAFHITDENNIDNIKKIIGKRSSISTFKHYFNVKSVSGIQTSGGIIMKVSGILDFASSDDVMSFVDYSETRRWVSSAIFSESLANDLIKHFNRVEDFNSMNSIRNYMLTLYDLIDKHHEEIQKGLLAKLFSIPGSSWSELLVRNIQVLSIGLLTGYGNDDNDDEVIAKLKEITPNVYVFDTGKELEQWYLESGGYLKQVDMQQDMMDKLSNEKRNKLLTYAEGIAYLAKHDIAFLKQNFDKAKDVIKRFDWDEFRKFFRAIEGNLGAKLFVLKAYEPDFTTLLVNNVLDFSSHSERIELAKYVIRNINYDELTKELIIMVISYIGSDSYLLLDDFIAVNGNDLDSDYVTFIFATSNKDYLENIYNKLKAINYKFTPENIRALKNHLADSDYTKMYSKLKGDGYDLGESKLKIKNILRG